MVTALGFYEWLEPYTFLTMTQNLLVFGAIFNKATANFTSVKDHKILNIE